MVRMVRLMKRKSQVEVNQVAMKAPMELISANKHKHYTERKKN